MRIKPVVSCWRAVITAIFLASSCATHAEHTAADIVSPVPGWQAFVDELEVLPARLLAKLPPNMREDPLIQQEVARIVLQALTASSISAIGGYGNHPAFLPGIGELLNVGQPNADTLYRIAQITPGGVYRLRGRQGSLPLAVISQIGSEPADQEGMRQHLDIGALGVDDKGYFDVILSVERPDGHEGDWWPLHPHTHSLMLRLVSSDWANEREPTLAIERLDVSAAKPRPSAEELEQRLHRLPQATSFLAGMFIDHVEQLRQQGYINRLKVLTESDIGSGVLEGQFYYEGAYDLTDDEALIVEARHPASCDYRSVILTTELYQTTDWYNNHSSLNASQAKPDDDGVLRVVVSAKDPGVPNWLDTAGHSRGVIQGRWTGCDSQPVPSVIKVPVAEVRAHLPANTPTVGAEERQQIIRDRRAAYQQRCHW